MNLHYFLEPPYIAIWAGAIMASGSYAMYRLKILRDDRPDIAFPVLVIFCASVIALVAIIFDIRPPLR